MQSKYYMCDIYSLDDAKSSDICVTHSLFVASIFLPRLLDQAQYIKYFMEFYI